MRCVCLAFTLFLLCNSVCLCFEFDLLLLCFSLPLFCYALRFVLRFASWKRILSPPLVVVVGGVGVVCSLSSEALSTTDEG